MPVAAPSPSPPKSPIAIFTARINEGFHRPKVSTPPFLQLHPSAVFTPTTSRYPEDDGAKDGGVLSIRPQYEAPIDLVSLRLITSLASSKLVSIQFITPSDDGPHLSLKFDLQYYSPSSDPSAFLNLRGLDASIDLIIAYANLVKHSFDREFVDSDYQSLSIQTQKNENSRLSLDFVKPLMAQAMCEVGMPYSINRQRP